MGLGALREIPIVFGPHGVTSDVHIYMLHVLHHCAPTNPTQPSAHTLLHKIGVTDGHLLLTSNLPESAKHRPFSQTKDVAPWQP